MNAILIAIGNELTCGHIIESNCAWLAQQLAERGVATLAHWTVGDDRSGIARAITQAANDADVVIVSGGIGPTADDMTRHALADAMSDNLIRDDVSLTQIETFFAGRGWPMNETNRRQAYRPARAKMIENLQGTAPGLSATLTGATIYCLPGVPHEMRAMFDRDVFPAIAPAGIIVHRTIHTCGMGESSIGDVLHDLMTADGDLIVNTTAQAGVISVRLRARGQNASDADTRLTDAAHIVYDRLGEIIFGEGDATLATPIGDRLRARKHTLATAESCTGGLIGKLLTDASGASAYYRGGVIAYANEIKCTVLDVPQELLDAHGAVSPEVATAMALGCQKRFASDWAISTTGIAGPTGGSDEKPVGLVYMAFAGPEGVSVHRENLRGTRDHIRTRAAIVALNHLRLMLTPE